MAETTRSALELALGQRGFVQRFILAEILGPPKALARPRRASPPAAQPPAPPAGEGTKR